MAQPISRETTGKTPTTRTIQTRQNPDGIMPLFDHLEEARSRLVRCALIFMLAFIGLFLWGMEPVLEVLRRPLFEVLPADQQKLYFTSLFENFLTHLKIAGYMAVFFLSPYFFLEIWGFIKPGLKERERKLVIPFVLAGTFFFLLGGAFAYGVVFPFGFKYFVEFGGPADAPMLTIDSYYGTCMKLILLFGLTFELPVLITFFGFLGVVNAEQLRAHRRNAILGITVASALFAPPDAISMILMATPLILLYEASIWVVSWIKK